MQSRVRGGVATVIFFKKKKPPRSKPSQTTLCPIACTLDAQQQSQQYGFAGAVVNPMTLNPATLNPKAGCKAWDWRFRGLGFRAEGHAPGSKLQISTKRLFIPLCGLFLCCLVFILIIDLQSSCHQGYANPAVYS